MRNYRLKQLEETILENETVSLEELRESFGVSMNTIRRDIAELLRRGNIEKVYGGVCAKRKTSLLPYDQRHIIHLELKQRIGRKAAELIADGDVIYLDSGTTTLELIRAIQGKKRITVITGNLNAIDEALPFSNINVIATGGQLDRKTNSFVGLQVVQELRSYNIKKAFLAATGISLENGVTNSSLLEYEIKKAVVDRCDHNYLMVDSSKFGVSALTTYAQIRDFEAIVTDSMPSKEFLDCCNQAEISLLLAEENLRTDS